MSGSIDRATTQASRWLEQEKRDGGWRVPVKSEDLYTTALALNVIEDSRKEKMIEYLLREKVWRRNAQATRAMIAALKERGDLDGARMVVRLIQDDLAHDPSLSRVKHPDLLLKAKDIADPRAVAIYSAIFDFFPSIFWTSRRSVLYDPLPQISETLLLSGAGNREKMRRVLAIGINSDGSFTGHTKHAIRAAHALRMLGEDRLARKVVGWIDQTYNGDGSFKFFLYQDVYDTAWAAMALYGNGEDIKSIVPWLERTRVGDGYPYYSFSTLPDSDDTALVLLIKALTGDVGLDTMKVADFLVKAQNSDGGWGFIPINTLALGAPVSLMLRFKRLLDSAESSSLARLLTERSQLTVYQSTVDMTARALMALAHFRDRPNVRRSVQKGVSFLMSNCNGGVFHTGLRWVLSETYETSVALVALNKCGVSNEATGAALKWLDSQTPPSVEEDAHLLWAFSVCGNDESHAEKPLKRLLAGQLPDGAWAPGLAFTIDSPYLDYVFSTAAPMVALNAYSNRKEKRTGRDVP